MPPSDVSATDATLVRHDGRLWLFVAIAVDGNRATDSSSCTPPTASRASAEPHPMNPVVSGRAPRASRREGLLAERPPHQAGAGLLPFLRGRLVFNRIESLSPLEYRETTVGALEPAPDSGNLRTHSYDSDGTYEVLDGFRMRPRFSVRGISPSPTRPRWHRVDLELPGRERSILHS